jgi:hypothetical protein
MELQTETRHNNLEAESQTTITRLIESYFNIITTPPLSLVECYGNKEGIHYEKTGLCHSTMQTLKNGGYVHDRTIMTFLKKFGMQFDQEHYSKTGKIRIV